MLFNGINFEKLSYLKQYYSNPTRGVPKDSGVYYWVYWPDFNPNTISVNNLEKIFSDYSNKNLQFPEVLRGKYKFIAEIKEQKFDKNINSNPLFGLSPSKTTKLLNYFNTASNVLIFYDFFKEMCFARPFYVGKANNLRSRLVSHFNGNSDLISELSNQRINDNEVWIGYKKIPLNNSDEMNVIFEEILSRNLKPGLTKKPN